MKPKSWRGGFAVLALLLTCAGAARAEGADIVVGFANAKSGWLEAYDTPARRAALVAIDELNAKGGLLGRKIRTVEADTKTDRAQSAKAGLEVLDAGADLVVVSCDYDFGAPAALEAQKRGKVSFFLCAEDVKAGIQGVGKLSFSSSVLGAVQGATMAEWSHAKRNVRSAFVLLDSSIEYDKGLCTGFDWMFAQLAGATVVGRDSFKNGDASIAAQISRIKALPRSPMPSCCAHTFPARRLRCAKFVPLASNR